MNRSKRTYSCPNFNSKVNRRVEREILENTALLEKIQRFVLDTWKFIPRRYDGCLPRLLGHPIRLANLFVAVITRGGYKRVCDQRLWPDVSLDLGIPRACGNSSIGLRRIYHQFLITYELREYPTLSEQLIAQALADSSNPSDGVVDNHILLTTSVERSLGIAHPQCGNLHASTSLLDLSDRGRHSLKNFYQFQEYPSHTFGEKSHLESRDSYLQNLANWDQIAESRDVTCLREPTELRLAELALASGLPNEVDVALNSLLVLSITPSLSGSSSAIRLAHCTNLLSLLLASVGIYSDGFGSLILCDDIWRKQSQLKFLRFWHSAVVDVTGRLFLRPDVFINADVTEDELRASENELFSLFSQNTSSSLTWMNTNEDLETSRVLVVATLLVNLVTPPPIYPSHIPAHLLDEDEDLDFGPFAARTLSPRSTPLSTWRENARIISSNPTALRFSFLCAYCRYSNIRHLGLQLISSLRYPLDPSACPLPLECPSDWTPLIADGCRLGQLTLAFLIRAVLESDDRADLIGGLNFLANLAKVPDRQNAASLLDGLPQSVWPRLAQLLCLPDLAIVCASLEALRCLTNLGVAACTICWQACVLEGSVANINAVPLMLLRPLLALLTLEGQAMGSKSLHRIRLMQRPSQMQHMPTNPMQHVPHVENLLHSTSRTTPHPMEASFHSHRNRKEPSFLLPRQPKSQYSTIYPKAPSLPVDKARETIGPNSPLPNRVMPSNSPTYHSPVPSNLEPHAPQLHPTVSPITHPLPQTYRTPNASTSCTGLINLLSSNAPTVLDCPSSTAVTNSSPISSSSNTPIKLPVSTSTPSLSEITDRLQMPPPSLPPPSALRRSAKWSQSRPCPITPPLSTKSKPNNSSAITVGPGPKETDRLCPNSSTTNTGIESPNNGQPKSTTKSECSNLTSLLDQNDNDEFPMICANANKDDASEDKSIENCDLKLENDSSGTVAGSAPNGDDKSKLVNDDDDDDDVETKTQMKMGYTNGLKPSLLQAAVMELNKRSQNMREISKISNCVHSNHVNGLPETESRTNLEMDDLKAERQPESDKKSLPSDIVNSTPVPNGHLESETCEKNEPLDNPETTTTGLVNGSTDQTSVNRNSGTNRMYPSLKTAPEILQRLLKRRRKWGSRNRLFTPKKRREAIDYVNFKKLNTTTESSGSPLKPLPLKHDLVPGSVLGPSWKPPCPSVLDSESVPKTENETLPQTDPDSQRIEESKSPSVESQEHLESLIAETESSSSSKPCSDESESNEKPSHQIPESPPIRYYCEWESCDMSFEIKAEVASHVYQSHLSSRENLRLDNIPHPVTGQKYLPQLARRCCRWRGCQSASVARAPFALMTHVLDMHCSSRELELRRVIYLHSSTSNPHLGGKHLELTNSSPLTPANPEHCTGDQSAWSIIHAIDAKNMQAELWAAHHHLMATNPNQQSHNLLLNPAPFSSNIAPPPREGPVTKHLRVTAALVLRNFVTHLSQAATWLLSESQLLSELVMGCSPSEAGLRTNDAGHIIAQCLALCQSKSKVSSFSFRTNSSDHISRTALFSKQPYLQSQKRNLDSFVCRPMETNVDLDSDDV